jgi:glycosyltransferase involved in cell wall biosynthesis
MIDEEKLPKITPAPVNLILPVFNQEKSLSADVGPWLTHLQKLGWGHEVIIVDDGSFDDTQRIAAGLPAIVLRHEKRSGLGAALRTGLQAARHPLIAYVADPAAYDPADLEPMCKWIDEVHLVAGRRVQESKRPISSRCWIRWAARWVFGVHMHDLGCYFLMARREIFQRIPFQSNGTFAHIEVLAKANFLGSLMTEVPVRCRGNSVAWDDEPARTRAEAMKLLRDPNFGPVRLETLSECEANA